MHLPILADAPELPTLLQRWLDPVLGGPLPAEPNATCSSCAMAPRDGQVHEPGGVTFDPQLKCCTFVPSLPNFAVGAALQGSADGRRRVEARLAAGAGVTPLGLEPTPREALLAREGRAGFGHAHALRCPFLDDAGGCSIWAHRNAVCATWYCRHSRGRVGRALWRAVKLYLSAAERTVALHCAMHLDVGDAALASLVEPTPRAPAPLAAHELDDRLLVGHARATWGRWYGREAAFFRAAAEEAATIDAGRLQSLGGVALAARARALRAAWTGLADDALPPRTRLGALRIHGFAGGVVTVEGYSDYDALDVPEALLAVLPYFDGAEVDEARARCLAERGIDVTPALVRRLLDFGILEAADEAGAPA